MRIGLLSQSVSQHDSDRFKRAAKRIDVELKILTPYSLTIAIRDDKLTLLDENMKPLTLNGIINWEPYPVFEEAEKACTILNIPFINSVNAVRTARNKMLTSLALFSGSLPQPDTFYHNNPDLKRSLPQFGTPLVYKPNTGTQGRGALLLKSPDEISSFAEARCVRNSLYLQRFVPNEGWDIRVVVVGTRVLGAIKKTAADGEWRTHVIYGGKTAPFPLSKDLAQLALRAAQALNLKFAGLDVMVDNRDGRFKILEANSVPGLKIFEEATGVSIADAILEQITEAAVNIPKNKSGKWNAGRLSQL